MRNGVNIRDLNGVETSTSQLPLIGYTVFWRLAGIRVSHPDLDRALQATGFDKYLPDTPTPRVALRRALAEWIRAKPANRSRALQLQQDDEDRDENGGGHRRTMIRVINRAGSEHLVYALVAEDIDFSALGLSYGTALRILLHKKTGEMICTTDAEGVINAHRESLPRHGRTCPLLAAIPRSVHRARPVRDDARERCRDERRLASPGGRRLFRAGRASAIRSLVCAN